MIFWCKEIPFLWNFFSHQTNDNPTWLKSGEKNVDKEQFQCVLNGQEKCFLSIFFYFLALKAALDFTQQFQASHSKYTLHVFLDLQSHISAHPSIFCTNGQSGENQETLFTFFLTEQQLFFFKQILDRCVARPKVAFGHL